MREWVVRYARGCLSGKRDFYLLGATILSKADLILQWRIIRRIIGCVKEERLSVLHKDLEGCQPSMFESMFDDSAGINAHRSFSDCDTILGNSDHFLMWREGMPQLSLL